MATSLFENEKPTIGSHQESLNKHYHPQAYRTHPTTKKHVNIEVMDQEQQTKVGHGWQQNAVKIDETSVCCCFVLGCLVRWARDLLITIYGMGDLEKTIASFCVGFMTWLASGSMPCHTIPKIVTESSQHRHRIVSPQCSHACVPSQTLQKPYQPKQYQQCRNQAIPVNETLQKNGAYLILLNSNVLEFSGLNYCLHVSLLESNAFHNSRSFKELKVARQTGTV